MGEQLDTVLAKRNAVSNAFYSTIGGQANQTYDCPVCHNVLHLQQGFEEDTLQLLYDHCLAGGSKTVAYIHSKGSYHDFGGANEKFRRFAMRGVFSKACRNMPPSCNICASRF